MILSKNHPFWSIGFRPFFLFASFWALLIIVIWISFQEGSIQNLPHFPPTIWHSHEMIYGFLTAVLAGFLLTATQNWTGIRGVHARPLQLLFTVWLVGRLGIYFFPHFLSAILDLSFYPLLAYFLFPYLSQQNQKRNRIFFVLLALLFIGNFFTHFGNSDYQRIGIFLGIDVFLIITTLIAGRIIPFFTSRALPSVTINSNQWVERLSMITIALYALGDIFFQSNPITAWVALLAGITHLIRWCFWKFWKTTRIPILWILHISYFWIIFGLLGRSFVLWPDLFNQWFLSLSTHALTIGGLSGIVYGMMTRVSLGHTGRPIHAARGIVLGYIFINLAVVSRIFLPMIKMEWYFHAIRLSGLFWIFAFLIFVFYYFKILTSPRAD